jgi:hypothetical protein
LGSRWGKWVLVAGKPVITCDGGCHVIEWKIAALVAPLLLLGGFSLLGAQNAGAASANHKVQFSGNHLGPFTLKRAIETKAKVKYTCNATTGVYNIKVKNFSEIGGDGTLLVGSQSGDPNRLTIEVNTHEVFEIVLTQNPATELFDANPTGILPTLGDCHTGASLEVNAVNSGDDGLAYDAVGALS